jgi:hypothetical protein
MGKIKWSMWTAKYTIWGKCLASMQSIKYNIYPIYCSWNSYANMFYSDCCRWYWSKTTDLLLVSLGFVLLELINLFIFCQFCWYFTIPWTEMGLSMFTHSSKKPKRKRPKNLIPNAKNAHDKTLSRQRGAGELLDKIGGMCFLLVPMIHVWWMASL